jgi:hypothetical protein
LVTSSRSAEPCHHATSERHIAVAPLSLLAA